MTPLRGSLIEYPSHDLYMVVMVERIIMRRMDRRKRGSCKAETGNHFRDPPGEYYFPLESEEAENQPLLQYWGPNSNDLYIVVRVQPSIPQQGL